MLHTEYYILSNVYPMYYISVYSIQYVVQTIYYIIYTLCITYYILWVMYHTRDTIC